jgi:hypothetical protein
MYEGHLIDEQQSIVHTVLNDLSWTTADEC